MISLWNLAWIIPLSVILGMLLAALLIANREYKNEHTTNRNLKGE